MPKYRLSVDETVNTMKFVDIETNLSEIELDALLTKIETNSELTCGEDLAKKLEGQNVKVTGIIPSTQSYYVEAKTLEIEKLKEPKKLGFMIQCKACDLRQEDIEKALEKAREEMNISIVQNGEKADITIRLSQSLDNLIVAYMRK